MSLRSLGGDVKPPEHLKSRVIQSLRDRGVFQPHRRWWPLAAALAGLGLFTTGYFVGRGASGEPAAVVLGAPRYALLLYEDAAFDSSQAEQALVTEYGAWAGQLVTAGHDVGGEKLGFEVGILPAAGAAGPGRLTGFFIVSAASDSAALAVARGSPHRRHGGRVVVRRVDPT